ncbi:MAG: hypothetical protein ACOY3K_07320 [Candidatus Omnitrophota bacterium]
MNTTLLSLWALYATMLVLAALYGRTLLRTGSPGKSPAEKRLVIITLIATVTYVGFLVYKIYDVVFDVHNWIRVEKTFVVAMGHPLYTPKDSGPAMANIYGPVSVFAYWPATWSRDPMIALRIAELIALSFFFFPAFWLHLSRTGITETSVLERSAAFLAFGMAATLLTSLRNAAFTVHADAPTFGLCTLACGVIYFSKGGLSWKRLWVSASFAALAVWSKQVVVLLFIAVTVFIGLRNGRKDAFRYLFCFALAGLLISSFFLLCFDPKNMFFNMITVPSHHPLKAGGFPTFLKAFTKLSREWLIILLWGVFSMGPRILEVKKYPSFRLWFTDHPWTLFIFAGIAMIPISLLSFLKVGGSNNTLSYPNFFFLLASTLAFLAPRRSEERRNLKALAILLSFLSLVHVPGLFARIYQTKDKVNFGLIAYRYALAHPGKTYFARMTLINLLADGKVYHTIDGLMDRYWAGFPIVGEHLRAHIPPQADLMALCLENDKWLLPLEEFPSGRIGAEGLPEFTVYKRVPAVASEPS